MPFHDVEIHSTDEMNRALAEGDTTGRHKPGMWAIVFANGDVGYYPTEDAACAAQREWRRDHKRDPITGEAVSDDDGTNGQDRESYSDTQDRDTYIAD